MDSVLNELSENSSADQTAVLHLWHHHLPLFTFFHRLQLQFDSAILLQPEVAALIILSVAAMSLWLSTKIHLRRLLSWNKKSTLVPRKPPGAVRLNSVLRDEFIQEKKSATLEVLDARYAEELQIQEALVASISVSRIPHKASSSTSEKSFSRVKLQQNDREVDKPSECGICLDRKERWEMFQNYSCSHSFCCECTSKHIVAKIEGNALVISCPAVGCNAMIDRDACRSMIPHDALVRWDDILCQSMIQDSEKLYCPFSDCSAMLVNDTGEVIRNIKCPSCKRAICALCRVPWHTEFSCKEFQKLKSKKGEAGDSILKSLARKKNWQKCPRCKIYVEKTEGCLHMTCRCGHQFCYRCGAKWSFNHGGCRAR